jgi:hypothetical protein
MKCITAKRVSSTLLVTFREKVKIGLPCGCIMQHVKLLLNHGIYYLIVKQ